MTQAHTSSAEKPEALRLAEMLDNGKWCNYEDRSAAATELRRQHARIAELDAELESRGFVKAISERITRTT